MNGLGLDGMSLAWPAVVQLVVSFNCGSQWILEGYFSLFYHGGQFDFYVVAYGALIEGLLREPVLFLILCSFVVYTMRRLVF